MADETKTEAAKSTTVADTGKTAAKTNAAAETTTVAKKKPKDPLKFGVETPLVVAPEPTVVKTDVAAYVSNGKIKTKA